MKKNLFIIGLVLLFFNTSAQENPDNLYHLFYSRWKKKDTFSGWLTFSEVAHAVSKKPTGP